MAALPILTRDDELGIIFVQDTRPDGTAVVLKCQASTTGGVATLSHHPDEEDAWYPLAEQMGYAAAERGVERQFRLVLDTSELPRGPLAFDIDRFVEQVEAARGKDEPIIYLDEKTAAEWGFKGEIPRKIWE
jgi:hypothetical protein